MWRNDRRKASGHRHQCLLLLLLVVMPLTAFAYLDPTTGSMIISAVVGLFASLVLAIRTYWHRLKSLFRSKPAESDADDGTA